MTPHADGGVWVGFPLLQHANLTSAEAEEMADALRAHAHHSREKLKEQS